MMLSKNNRKLRITINTFFHDFGLHEVDIFVKISAHFLRTGRVNPRIIHQFSTQHFLFWHTVNEINTESYVAIIILMISVINILHRNVILHDFTIMSIKQNTKYTLMKNQAEFWLTLLTMVIQHLNKNHCAITKQVVIIVTSSIIPSLIFHLLFTV